MLGVISNAITEIRREVTNLPSVGPLAVKAAIQRRMEMCELGLAIAGGIGDLVEPLDSEPRELVLSLVGEMETATEIEGGGECGGRQEPAGGEGGAGGGGEGGGDAAPMSIDSPCEEGGVVVGQVADAKWRWLLELGNKKANRVTKDAGDAAEQFRLATKTVG